MADSTSYTLQLIIKALDQTAGPVGDVEKRIASLQNRAEHAGRGLQQTGAQISGVFNQIGSSLASASGTFSGSLDPLKMSLDQIGLGIGAIQGRLGGLSGAFGVFITALPAIAALGAATEFLSKSLRDAAQETQNVMAIQSAWKATERGTTEEMNNLVEATKELSRTSIYPSQDVIQAMNMLLGLKEIATRDVLPAMQVVIDFAAQSGLPIQQAAYVISAAARGNIRELHFWGFTFSQATQQSKNFHDMLGEMGKRVSGQEAARFGTYTGAVGALAKAFNQVEKAVGHVIEAPLVPVIQDLTKFFKALGKDVEEATKSGASEQWSERIKVVFLRVAQYVKDLTNAVIKFVETGGLERIVGAFETFISVTQTFISIGGKVAQWFIMLPSWVYYGIAAFLGFKVVAGIFRTVYRAILDMGLAFPQTVARFQSYLAVVLPGLKQEIILTNQLADARRRANIQGPGGPIGGKGAGPSMPWVPGAQGAFSPWTPGTKGPPVMGMVATGASGPKAGIGGTLMNVGMGAMGVLSGKAAIEAAAQGNYGEAAMEGGFAALMGYPLIKQIAGSVGRLVAGVGTGVGTALAGVGSALGLLGVATAPLTVGGAAAIYGIKTQLADPLNARAKKAADETDKFRLQNEGLSATQEEAYADINDAANKSGEDQEKAATKAAETYAKAGKTFEQFTADFKERIAGEIPAAAKTGFEYVRSQIKKTIEGDPFEVLTEGMVKHLMAMRAAGTSIGEEQKRLMAMWNADPSKTSAQREMLLKSLKEANKRVMEEDTAFQTEMKKNEKELRGGDTGAVESKEQILPIELRLELLKNYYEQQKAIEDAIHEEQKTRVWASAANAEEAQRRIKALNTQQALESLALIERQYQDTKQLRDSEYQLKREKAEGDNAKQELDNKYFKESGAALTAHQKEVFKIIADTEKKIQELYKERFELQQKMIDAERDGAAALDSVRSKQQSDLQNLSDGIRRASEETQRALALLPEQPEKAIQVATKARQMWQSLAQDVRGLEDQLRQTGRFYENFYTSIAKKTMAPEQAAQVDLSRAMKLKNEAMAFYNAGDDKRAQERIREARQIVSEVANNAAPGSGMQEKALAMMRQVQAVDEAIGKTAVERAKAVEATRYDATKQLNDTIENALNVKLAENTAALDRLKQALEGQAGYKPTPSQPPKEARQGTETGTGTSAPGTAGASGVSPSTGMPSAGTGGATAGISGQPPAGFMSNVLAAGVNVVSLVGGFFQNMVGETKEKGQGGLEKATAEKERYQRMQARAQQMAMESEGEERYKHFRASDYFGQQAERASRRESMEMAAADSRAIKEGRDMDRAGAVEAAFDLSSAPEDKSYWLEKMFPDDGMLSDVMGRFREGIAQPVEEARNDLGMGGRPSQDTNEASDELAKGANEAEDNRNEGIKIFDGAVNRFVEAVGSITVHVNLTGSGRDTAEAY